jgi:hypothetical protein
MKNRSSKKDNTLLLLLVAGAAYWYFFMRKKPMEMPITQPGFMDQPGQPGQPGSSAPAQELTMPAITTESANIVDQIVEFSQPESAASTPRGGSGMPVSQFDIDQAGKYGLDIESYQNYYVKQVSGVRRNGVPYTI